MQWMSGSSSLWTLSHRADPAARVIADRHYSRQSPGSSQFVPPGRCLVLVRPHAYWVTSWPFAEYVKHAWAGAMICSAFRNEDRGSMSSELIRDALACTRWKWPEIPPLGMVTFVDTEKVRRKRDPGRCFRKAGFTPCGHTKGGLFALRLDASDFPKPTPPCRAQEDLLKAL